jgi:mono/diheme cytochrome c family protein
VKTGLKWVGWVLASLLGIVILVSVAFTIYALVGYRKAWNFPLPATHAVADTAVIARGRYLVNGPMHCADCHAPDSVRSRLFHGEEVPLTGGTGEKTFLGTWGAPNLTPDSATGLGRVSDGQLARMLRNGINRENHIGLPFMDNYADLSESDLMAVLSYLRALPPTPGSPPSPQVNLLGKITLAYFIKPYGPKAPPSDSFPPEVSAQYGAYLANTACGCRSCHTARNLKTGEYLSPFFAGGLAFHSRLRPGYVYVSPNLTPDTATGHIAAWSEEKFLHRFREGLLIADDPMPWGSYVRMDENDIRALYRYFRSLNPVHQANGPVEQPGNGRPAAGG